MSLAPALNKCNSETPANENNNYIKGCSLAEILISDRQFFQPIKTQYICVMFTTYKIIFSFLTKFIFLNQINNNKKKKWNKFLVAEIFVIRTFVNQFNSMCLKGPSPNYHKTKISTHGDITLLYLL